MSVFQVTQENTGIRLTLNANQVIAVQELTAGNSAITTVGGDVVITKETYRSVRNYLKKALAPASKDVE